MNVEFTALRLKLDPRVKEIAEKRFAKLAKVLPTGAQAKVVLKAQKRGVSFEITVKARQRTWTAEAVEVDQLTAIHAALERIAGQAKKTKAIVKEVKKHTASGVKTPAVWKPAPGEEAAQARAGAPRTETSEARPMFDEDAFNRFESSKKEVLVYRDPSDDSFRFLYRKRDGSIALLIPA